MKLGYESGLLDFTHFHLIDFDKTWQILHVIPIKKANKRTFEVGFFNKKVTIIYYLFKSTDVWEAEKLFDFFF